MHFLKTFLFEDLRLSWFWLLVRIYVGWQWLHAGYEKLINPAWFGSDAGSALTGFINGALSKTTGAHPDVSGWYASFLKSAVLPGVHYWSHIVTFGEIFVGLGLILGAFTFLAAFFGFFMNLNFLLSGTVSINPQLLVLSLLIMLAHKSSSYIGLDYYIHKVEKSWALFRHI
jgi:thiosulfate dehydrogenase [quinone] large subunit